MQKKQVPSCEFFPMEAVKTNVIGTDNVLTAAIEEGVKAVVCLSTDKAAYPVNAMGISKALEKRVAVAKSGYSGKPKICCTRHGTICAVVARGSVPLLWIEQIRDGSPITLTDGKICGRSSVVIRSVGWSQSGCSKKDLPQSRQERGAY